jgi:hypothetical protein
MASPLRLGRELRDPRVVRGEGSRVGQRVERAVWSALADESLRVPDGELDLVVGARSIMPRGGVGRGRCLSATWR